MDVESLLRGGKEGCKKREFSKNLVERLILGSPLAADAEAALSEHQLVSVGQRTIGDGVLDLGVDVL
jgi:hypothetical protein